MADTAIPPAPPTVTAPASAPAVAPVVPVAPVPAGQAPVPAVAAPVAAPAPKGETPSERFARLAQRESKFREQESAYRAREQQLAAREQAAKDAETRATEFTRFQQLAKTDPVAYLKAGGIEGDAFTSLYRQMSSHLIDGKELPPPGPEAEIARLRQELEETKTGFNTRMEEAWNTLRSQREQEEVSARQQYEQELIGHISDNRPKYPFIVANDLAWKVDEVIRLHEKETGRILRVDTACDMVEDVYRKSNHAILQSAATPAAPIVALPVAQAALTPAPGLTQRMGSPVATPPVNGQKPLSDVDRAIAKYAETHAANVASGRYRQ